jgi:hypothetical protein
VAAERTEAHADQDEDEKDQNRWNRELLVVFGDAGQGFRLTPQSRQNGPGAIDNSPRPVTCAKRRNDLVLNDDTGFGIGQRAFQAVSDFDAHLPFIGGNNQQNAIVLLRLTDAPGAPQFHPKLLYGPAIEALHGDHHHLLTCFGLVGLQHFDKIGFRACGEQIGFIDNAAGQFGQLDLRCHSPRQQQDPQGNKDPGLKLDNEPHLRTGIEVDVWCLIRVLGGDREGRLHFGLGIQDSCDPPTQGCPQLRVEIWTAAM